MSEIDEGGIIRVESTLLRVPIFALAVRGSASLDGVEYRRVGRRGDRAVESIIRTERDEKTPYPGPLSRRVHMALLGLVAERGFPFENPLSWTWRDLCRRMGLPASGRRDMELKAALRSTWGLKIFGLGAREGRERETWRHLYAECEFMNEARADGTIAGLNRLWLAPWYVDGLNAFHAAPISYDLWKTLDAVGPLASRLYEYLVPAFYKRESLELAYDRLAAAMPVIAETRRSHAIRQFAPALAAAVEAKLVSGFAWDAMKGTGRPKLVLDRGSRLAPPTQAGQGAGAAPGSGGLPRPPDPEAAKRLAAEFYRLLGKPDTSPMRSDLAIAGNLLARFGPDRAANLLPTGVRMLKARFRNAETMGALVRYVDEAAREQDNRREATDRDKVAQHAKAADEAGRAAEDHRQKAAWDAIPEEAKAALRTRVLADHPSWTRFPALVEAQCVDLALKAKAVQTLPVPGAVEGGSTLD